MMGRVAVLVSPARAFAACVRHAPAVRARSVPLALTARRTASPIAGAAPRPAAAGRAPAAVTAGAPRSATTGGAAVSARVRPGQRRPCREQCCEQRREAHFRRLHLSDLLTKA